MPRLEERGMAAAIARRAQLASILLLGMTSLAIAADKTAELTDEFLEYLGSLEGDDANWLDFAAASAAAKQSAKSQAQGVNDKTSRDGAAASSSSSSRALPQAASVNTSAASQTGKVEK